MKKSKHGLTFLVVMCARFACSTFHGFRHTEGSMPGPAIHHMIATRILSNVLNGSGLGDDTDAATYHKIQNLLSNPKNHPYLFLGSQGPDPLFFNTKDIDGNLATFIKAYIEVGDFIEEIKEKIKNATPDPILEALEAFDQAANAVISSSSTLTEIKQLFQDMKLILESIKELIEQKIEKYVSDFDLFEILSHPYRDGVEEGKWWWFDAMHYRKTGEFTEAMLEASRDMSSPIHLYALGYLSHFSADTVGHSYVNLWSGGAYRSHAQRHKTGENFQDVFCYSNMNNGDFNISKLHQVYNFSYEGNSQSELPLNPSMPDDLASFLADLLNKIYQEDEDNNPDYANRISSDDVKAAYRLWFRFFRQATDGAELPKPRSYSLTAELTEVWEHAKENMGGVADFLEDATNTAGSFGILGIFIVLAALIIAAVLAALAIIDAILGMIATLGTSTIRYAACLVYEHIYNAYQSLRLAVSLNGLAFPMREHLSDPRLKQFISPSRRDPVGVSATLVYNKEPLLRFKQDALGNSAAATIWQERHLIYPLTDGEKKQVHTAPSIYMPNYASFPAFGKIYLDKELIEKLVNLQAIGGDENDLLNVLASGRTLGNAVDLTGELYCRWLQHRKIPAFNLDADRGYGYLCWTQTGDEPHRPKELVTNASASDPREVSLKLLP